MRRALLVGVLAALLAVCGGASATATKTFDNPKGTITVAEHAKFTIALDAKAGTGFTWKVTTKPDAKIVKYLSTRTGSASRPGGPTQQLLTFQAGDTGTTSMTLSYVGPGRNPTVGKKLPLKVKVART